MTKKELKGKSNGELIVAVVNAERELIFASNFRPRSIAKAGRELNMIVEELEARGMIDSEQAKGLREE